MTVFRPVVAVAVWIGFCLALLAGCAAGPGSAVGGVQSAPLPSAPAQRVEVVTESDESEPARRARLRMELASGYFEQGQTEVALDEIKRVLLVDPNNSDAFNLRGLVFMRLGDNRQAEENFRRALSIKPNDPGTVHNLGWLMCQEAKYPLAFRFFQQALDNPNYRDIPRSFLTLGLCQARSGDRVSAERTLTRSYELDPGNPITAFNLAQLTFEKKDFARTQFLLRRINSTEQANAETLWLGARVERQLRNEDGVSQLGDQLRKRFPNSRQTRQLDRRAFDE